MSKKPLTVLFTPVDGLGHINASAGLGHGLLSRGHRVVFSIGRQFQNAVESMGFEVFVIEKPGGGHGQGHAHGHGHHGDSGATEAERQHHARMHHALDEALKSRDYFETTKILGTSGQMKKMVDALIAEEPVFEAILSKVKPDVVVVDNVFTPVAVIESGVPYINLYSAAPLFYINDPLLPPAGCGLPLDDSADWERHRSDCQAFFDDSMLKPWADHLASNGLRLERPPNFNLVPSPHANFFMYPQEIDYFSKIKVPANFYRFDTLMRHEARDFAVPDKLRHLPGKLVYFSLGSHGSTVLPLLQRIVDILSESPNRFIVSAGPSLDKLVLPPNVWAAKSVPQTAVLAIVDLFITHGGNNSTTETLFFGKPMIVLPLMADQVDNAQRVTEAGFGLRFHAWHVGKEELLAGIERMLNDGAVQERLKRVSGRIQAANCLDEAAKVVERIAEKAT